jgi:hypothetical protein
MSKQISIPQELPKALNVGEKQVIKIAKGQHMRVQDLVDGKAKAAADVIAVKKGNNLSLKFADGTELEFENYYIECAGDVCSVSVASSQAGGHVIDADAIVGTATNSGELVYAYGEQSGLMAMVGGDSTVAGALSSAGSGMASYAAGAGAGVSAGAGLGAGVWAAIGGGVVLAAAAGGGGESNKAPTVAATQSVTTAEDTATSVTVSATDANKGDTLTYVATGATRGTVTGGAGGVFTYTPNGNYSGSDSFTVTVTDSKGASATQVVTISVSPVEDEAVGTLSVTGTAVEGGSLTASLTGASDLDGAISGTAYQWQISANGTSWTNISGATSATYALASDQSQVGQFVRVVVTTTDALGGTTAFTGASSAAIANVNDAPTAAASQAVTTAEDTAKTVTVSGSDADGDSLTHTAGSASNGTVTGGTGGVFSYTPNSNYVGSDSFTVTVSDGKGGTATQTVNVTVTAVDDEATGTLGVTGTAVEGGSLTASLTGASDLDGAITSTSYQWQISANGTSWTNISGATSATYALASDQSQVGQFVRVVVTTTDALGGTTDFIGTSSVAIANVNDAPTNITLSSSQITENTVTTGGVKIADISIADPDTSGNNNVLTVSGADAAQFEIRNGTELYFIGSSPNYETKTNYSIAITSTDGALTYSKNFTVAVTNVDESGITGATTLAEGQSTALSVKVEGVANGTVISYTLSGTNITASDISGGLSGSFTVTDGVGTINISALSDRLTEGNEQLTVTLGGAASSIPAYIIIITDISLSPVTIVNGGTYTAAAGVVDTFIIDANQTITATIIGFEEGDIIEILNSSESLGINFDNPAFGDGNATIFVSASATINLTGLSSDAFGDEASFENIYGPNAITYVM